MSISWQSVEPVPALVVHPPDVASLDEAHAAIEQWEFYSRKRLDSPQRLAVEHMLATRADGSWAARTTGRAEPRQNGKGDELEVVESWDLTQRGAPIVHTAHEIPTATSAHLRLLGHLYSHRDLRRKVLKAPASNSYRAIEMVNGGVIVYRTRTAGGGRGLDDIARLVVDEAQHAQPEQLAASTPILAVNPNPQTNYTGSAGIEDRSLQWWGLRKRALAPDGGDFAWLEHSAEQVSLAGGKVLQVRPDSADVANWIRANHAFPERIPAAFLAEQLRVLGPELFGREHLCVWDPPPLDAAESVISVAAWSALVVAQPPTSGNPVFFLDASPHLASASIGVALSHGGLPYLELDDYRRGADWLPDRAAGLAARHPSARFAVLGTGAATTLLPALKDRGIEPEQFTIGDMGRACSHLQKLVTDRAIQHSGDDHFTNALAAAVPRDIGDDLWTWSRRKSGDISPLVAVTGAAWLLESHPAYDLLASVY